MTMLEETLVNWWNGAREEGRVTGREKGQMEGRQQMLLRLLEKRFGRLPRKIHRQVGALTSVQELDRIFDSALAAGSLKELGLG